MSEASDGVVVEELVVRRALGIDYDQAFTIAGLSPGLNLVHGPNGSGKTTAARAVHQLLWPHDSEFDRPTIAGRLRIGDARWRIVIDAGHPAAERDGHPQRFEALGPFDLRHRYRLSLDDLLHADDPDFARRILADSRGDFDPDALAQQLGSSFSPTRPLSLSKALRDRRAQLDAARKVQDELTAAESLLERDRRRLADIERRLQQRHLLEQAREHRRQRAHLVVLEEQRAAYDPVLEHLHGDEAQRLRRIDERLADLAASLAAGEVVIADNEAVIAAEAFPDGSDPAAASEHLRERHAHLQELEGELVRVTTAVREAEAEARAALEQLGPIAPLDADTRARLLGRSLNEVSRLAHDGMAVAADLQALESTRRLIRQHLGDDGQASDRDRLDAGIRCLHEWLAAASGDASQAADRRSLPAMIAVALVALFAIILGVRSHVLWLLALLPAGALVAWELLASRARGGVTVDERAGIEQRYRRLELPAPAAWDGAAVGARLHDLLERLTATRLAEGGRQEIDRLEALGDDLEHRQADLQERAEILRDELGLSCDPPAAWQEWLPPLVDRWQCWLRAEQVVSARHAHSAELRPAITAELASANELLAALGAEGVDSALALDRRLHQLDERRFRLERARTALVEARRRHDAQDVPARVKAEEERRELLAHLGIAAGEEQRLGALLADKPAYDALRQTIAETASVLAHQEAILAEAPDLLALDEATIEGRLAAVGEDEAGRESLVRHIADIQAQVAQAKGGTTVAAARAAVDAVQARLDDHLADNCDRIAAQAVIEHLRSRSACALPATLERANALLAEITGGALQVGLDDRDGTAAFTARHASGTIRPLHRLSAGERVQVLIAIRLAHLAADERARLPLILDEALGNSDDHRAGAIIDAVLDIAAGGRQVFYCTAQLDEVGKWQARIDQRGTPCRVIDLAEVRRLERIQTLAIAPPAILGPPDPAGHDHAAYGRLIAPPSIAIGDNAQNDLHLWYLIRDCALLHRCLTQRIETWGQLDIYRRHADDAAFSPPERVELERATLRHAIIRSVAGLAAQGRGMPVDRRVLEDSGAVSGAFIDRVSALAAEHDGDARRLLASLRERAVPRWRDDNSERLQAYLESTGHLDPQDPLSPERIRIATLARFEQDLDRVGMTTPAIDQVVAWLTL